jgi:hypothetical protein
LILTSTDSHRKHALLPLPATPGKPYSTHQLTFVQLVHGPDRRSRCRQPRHMSAAHHPPPGPQCECECLHPSAFQPQACSRSALPLRPWTARLIRPQGSGSIIDPLNTYLASLCSSSTTTCSNTTLSSAETSLSSSCSSDISGGGTDAQEIEALLAALNSYPEVYTAACSKNST